MTVLLSKQKRIKASGRIVLVGRKGKGGSVTRVKNKVKAVQGDEVTRGDARIEAKTIEAATKEE